MCAKLIERSQHRAIFDQGLDRPDIIKTHHQNLVGFAGGINGLHRAQGHVVVRGHHALDIGVGGEQVRKNGKGFFSFPVGSFFGHHIELIGINCPIEAFGAGAGVFSAGNAAQDHHFCAFAQLFTQHIAHHFGGIGVVRANEGDVDTGFLHRFRVEPHVNVDDLDASFFRFSQNRHQRPRVGGSDDDGVYIL